MGAGQQQEESITASAFGQSVSAKGTSGIIILVLLVALVGAGWLLYQRSTEDRQLLTTIATTLGEHSINMQADHKAMAKGMESLVEVGSNSSKQLKIQNYIILADPSEKADIKRKLGRPSELQ